MNRAERRRRKLSAAAPKTYVLTEDQITKMKQDAAREATRRAFLMFMSIPVMVLHDKFGFGKQRLGKFMDYAVMWYESVHDNETQLMELVKVAGDECGVRVLEK
jgi:hypothetical protein